VAGIGPPFTIKQDRPAEVAEQALRLTRERLRAMRWGCGLKANGAGLRTR